MNNYSPNMFKTFDDCQQKFFLKYVEKVSLPQRSAFFEKGKKIHALANYYLNCENIEKMEKALTEDERKAWDSLKLNKYFKLNAENTEYNLSCKVNKYWIGGRLDALMKDGSNYIILDYKTGQIPSNSEMDFQTITYLLCTEKLLKRKYENFSLKFIYLGLKTNTEKEIVLTEQNKKQMEEKIISTCEKIDFAIKSNIFNKNKDHCNNCEYNRFCK